MASDKDIADFQARLDAISNLEGVPYKRAYLLFEEERKHKEAVLQYKGYLALSDAFKCFFLETVELINTYTRPKIDTPLSEFYSIFLPRLVHSFKSLCGAERMATCGYPHNAYSLIRNIFDDTLMTSATLQKFTDFYSIEGVTPGEPINIKSVKKLRKDTEYQMRELMTGSKSGLSKETYEELKKWDDMFDFEVHGGRLSLASAVDWMKGKDTLPVIPKFDEMEFGMFMNRFCEIGWMVHRLIPVLQPPNILFPNDWAHKWQVLDESFKVTVNSLTEQLGKKIGATIVELAEKKFPFNAQSTFPI